MADNVIIPQGGGSYKTAKTDDVNGEQVQYIKIMDGADGGDAVAQVSNDYGIAADIKRVPPITIAGGPIPIRIAEPILYDEEVTYEVGVSGSWTTVIPANPTRKALSLFNYSDPYEGRIVYVVFGDDSLEIATIAKFAILPMGLYEMPSFAIYTGPISMFSPGGIVSVHVGEV